MQLPFIELSLDVPFNPNHSYKFYLPTFDGREGWRNWWLTDLKFKVSDHSIYVAPQVGQPYAINVGDRQGTVHHITGGAADPLYVSIHDGGVINVHAKGSKVCVRGAQPAPPSSADPVVAIGIREPSCLKPAPPTEELNRLSSLAGKVHPLPVSGMRGFGTLYLSIYRTAVGGVWTPPYPGICYRTELKRKDVIYRFLVWQRPGRTPFQEDFAFFTGDPGRLP